MTQLVEDLRTAVSAPLKTDEYRQRHQQIDQELNERRQTAFTRGMVDVPPNAVLH